MMTKQISVEKTIGDIRSAIRRYYSTLSMAFLVERFSFLAGLPSRILVRC